jgi:acetyl esterase/lipase
MRPFPDWQGAGMRAAYRITAGVVTAVLVGVAGALILYQTSLQPGAAIVKAIFERGPLVTPPAGFAQIARTVTEQRVPVPTAGAPTAYLDIYTPDGGDGQPRPVILWIHGGGFISSSAATVADYTILLAHAGYTVASLDYSLAPGAQYPVQVRQGNAALGYLRANAARFGGDPARIVLGGDSAGAAIASEVAAVESDPALARSVGLTAALPTTTGPTTTGPTTTGPSTTGGGLRGVVLFCGLYDMRTVGSSGFPGLRTYLWAYTGVRDWTSYPAIDQLSTVLHVTPAYPPTFLSVGDIDPLRSQTAELASALRRQNVPLTTLLWTGTGDNLKHEYQFNFDLPQAQTAFKRTLAFLAATTRS